MTAKPGAPRRVSPPAPDPAGEAVLARLHPELARWLRRRFRRLSLAQTRTLPHVLDGRNVLLTAPTGSGKTLAGFLGVFDALARRRDAGEKPAGIACLYVSPLRALAYDMAKNLHEPLAQLGWDFIDVGVRTGDTPAAERAAQRRRPPQIFVTTPESLTLLLGQPAQAPALANIAFVIVDELHALAENKRGSLLAVGLERLAALRESTGRPPPQRLGLSATVAPLPTMAEFLCGPGRPCEIVAVPESRAARVEVFSPLQRDPYPPAGYTGMRLIGELRDLIASRRTTLIFTNTRSGAESVGLRLKQVMPELADLIEVHHASLDRAVRFEVEDRLKRGELRAVVCSTSLELGIDIGSIDTVVMVAAPKGVARALQRLGRSGHSPDETSHGVLVATNINDLAECAVTAAMMARRELDPLRIPQSPLDVLAQHLTALAVAADTTPDEAFALVRRSHPFRALPRELFDRVLRYLAGGGVVLERQYRPTFGKVEVRDGVLAVPHPRVAREFYQNVGTIVSELTVLVRHRSRRIGEVEESFIKRLRPGDVFVLNGRCFRLLATRLLEAKVEPAPAALPTVPRWNANKFPLGSGLAREVVRLRTNLAALLADPTAGAPAAVARLCDDYGLSEVNAQALVRQFQLQAHVSRIPTSAFFLVEVYAREELRHVFFHSLIGRSANDALSRIVAWRLRQAQGGNALVTIDDYGFLLTLRRGQVLDGEAWRPLFAPAGAVEALRSALADAELVKWQFRGVAQTALMVPRQVRGERRNPRMMQWSSEIIYEVLRKHEPDHPLLAEAYSEATLKFLDLPRALEFLEAMSRLPIVQIDTPHVSPFSFGMYVSGIKETMMLEDPEAAIERLFHELNERLADAERDAAGSATPAPVPARTPRRRPKARARR